MLSLSDSLQEAWRAERRIGFYDLTGMSINENGLGNGDPGQVELIYQTCSIAINIDR